MSDAKLLPSETAFVAALDRIAADHRDPTAWEGGCLYAALCAIAVGDHRTAEQKIALCAVGNPALSPPVQVFPPLTLDDLRDALAKLEKPAKQIPTDRSGRGRLAGPLLIIVALLATLVMLHP